MNQGVPLQRNCGDACGTRASTRVALQLFFARAHRNFAHAQTHAYGGACMDPFEGKVKFKRSLFGDEFLMLVIQVSSGITNRFSIFDLFSFSTN